MSEDKLSRLGKAIGNIIRRTLGGIMAISGGAMVYFAWAGMPQERERIWVWGLGILSLVGGLYEMLKAWPAGRDDRLIALAGTIAVLLWQAGSLAQIKPRQEYGFVVLVLVALAVGAVLFVLLPTATRCLLRHKDLLLPLGLLISLEGLFSALLAIPALAMMRTPAWSVSVEILGLSLSLAFAIQAFLRIVYAGWTTTLVIQAVRRDRVEPAAGLGMFGKWFWRVLILESIGWGALLAMLFLGIVLGRASIGVALVILGIGTLIWNLATAALLPIGLEEGRSLGNSIRQGIRVSWTKMNRWWLPVVAQMVLLGWVTFIHVSYTASTDAPPILGATRTVTTQTKTNWGVNPLWIGGYENRCRWHPALMGAMETEPPPLITSLLEIMLAVLAIAVKLKIVAELRETACGQQDVRVSPLSCPEGTAS